MVIKLAAIAPDVLPAVLSSKRIVERINAWTEQRWCDKALNVRYVGNVPVSFTKNERYRFTGGGFVAQPNPWRPFFPGYGTVWVERLSIDPVLESGTIIDSRRFALHPDIEEP